MQVRVLLPAPRQKKLTPFRFPGFRKRRESSISVSSFFLFQIEPTPLGFDLEYESIFIRPVTRTASEETFSIPLVTRKKRGAAAPRPQAHAFSLEMPLPA